MVPSEGGNLPIWCSVIAMMIIVFTVVFGFIINILLITVILRKKHLKTYMNVYFINLSVSDLIICCVTLLIRSGMFINGDNFPESVYRVDLFLQTLTDVVRMFLLVGVSFERHQAIAAPFKKGNSGRHRTIAGCVCSWVVAVILAIVCAILYENSLTFVFTGKSIMNSEETEMYFILPITFICLTIITVCYLAMLRHLYHHGKKMTTMRKKTAQVTPEVTVQIRSEIETVSHAVDAKILTNAAAITQTEKSQVLLQPQSNIPNMPAQNEQKVVKNVAIHDMDGTVHKEDVIVENKSKEIVGAVCVYNPKNRVQGKRRVEMRAAKRIAILMGIFLLLWLPFPIDSIICKLITDLHTGCRSSLALLSSISSLTAITNPLLYMLTNKQLKVDAKPLVENLMKCRRKK
ncbi:hypothetical protein LOTGIDRAFT_153627 [Lottia gigantea]|uniref:G-protein coupled receptors family 1 profile domain-containing protein n=1 Tax=Lottia gigantea TaxID=225164 RepID=V4A818_LOTGI|nr:hypothetical protein LOTGIDRAFT_153627 [Lottia gigantea]ESO91195.1 hypothetical protein LOTGIDRAFT_153627 [Lottia gigantea]